MAAIYVLKSRPNALRRADPTVRPEPCDFAMQCRYTGIMQKASGFTIIELMVVIAVIGILLGLGAPSFTEFVKNNRVTSQANDFVTALQTARSEAVKRGTYVTLCASSDQSSCSGSNDWSSGWIIFSDLDQDASPDIGTNACLPSEDCIIRTWGELDGDNTLTAASSSLQFQLSGVVTTGGETFTLTGAECSGRQVRKITVTAQGRPRIEDQSC
jgi:type IV fimbrial biogenesis protein FimT